MTKETLNLLLKTLSQINKNFEFVIQGSISLYLNNLIERLPNDLDILFLYNENNNLLDYNNQWKKFISNFKIKSRLIDSPSLKKYEIIFNDEIINIECILSKNIYPKHIFKIHNLLITSAKYSYSAKLCLLFYVLSKKYIKNTSIKKARQKIKQTIDDIFQIMNKFNTKDTIEIINEILEYEYKFNFFNSDENYWNIIKSYHKLPKIILKHYKNIDRRKLDDLILIVKNLFENKNIIKKIDNIDFILLTKTKLYKHIYNFYSKSHEQVDYYGSWFFPKNKMEFKNCLILFLDKINIKLNEENLKKLCLQIEKYNDCFAFDILNLYDLIFSQENYQNDFYLYKHSQHAKRNIIILCSINIFHFLAILIVALCMFIIFKPNIKWNLNKNEIITASILSFLMVAYCVGTILFYVFWNNNFEHKKWFWGFYIYISIAFVFDSFVSFLDNVSALIIMIGLLVFFIINFICYTIIYKKINVLSFKQKSSDKLTV